MQKEHCFVLKRFLPNKNKLSVLTENFGKIEIITRPNHKIIELWPSMLLSFNKNSRITDSKIFIAEKVEIIMTTLFDNTINIEWAHNILEICYYFIPLNHPEPKIFEFIYNSFNLNIIKNYFPESMNIIKKIYTLKLLTLIGFYPEKNLTSLLVLYSNITNLYIKIVDKNRIKLIKENLQDINKAEQIARIDTWILKCIASHPCFRNFKTINSFKNI